MLWCVVLCDVLFIPCYLERWAARVCWGYLNAVLKGEKQPAGSKCVLCPEGQGYLIALLCDGPVRCHTGSTAIVPLAMAHPLCPTLNIQVTGNSCPKEFKLGQNRGLIQSGWGHSLDHLEILSLGVSGL